MIKLSKKKINIKLKKTYEIFATQKHQIENAGSLLQINPIIACLSLKISHVKPPFFIIELLFNNYNNIQLYFNLTKSNKLKLINFFQFNQT